MKYLPTIGLEIHVELKTKTKMFCSSKNDPDEKTPNLNICPICMGHPGTLPVANEEAIKKLMLVGHALHCSIDPHTFFERKNYFYPDLPKGYQISQFQKPLCRDGFLEINGKKIRIERIHLEEDVARSQHIPGKDYTLIDFNRAGIPLMELVTHPDFTDSQDVVKFAQELRLALRYLGASDADMEKGQMRVEVNISVHPENSDQFGTKVEVKNINSINSAGRAVEYELQRQAELLESGGKVIQETRGWDDSKQCTVSQRIKEGSADYRYFPEPDLPPLSFTDEQIQEVRTLLPEMPWQRRVRFASEYHLPEADVEVFTQNKALGNLFEESVSEAFAYRPSQNQEEKSKTIKDIANRIINNYKPERDHKINAAMIGQLSTMVVSGITSSTVAGIIMNEMSITGLNPDNILHEKGLAQVTDSDELTKLVAQVIQDNPAAVADFKKGKEASLKFLVGKVMAASKGKANPTVAMELLQKQLT